MARYIAQVIILGSQVIGRAFARALQEEYAVIQTSVLGYGRNPIIQSKVNIKLGRTLEIAESGLLSKPCGHEFSQVRNFSVSFNNVFSDYSKENFIKNAERMKTLFNLKKHNNEAAVMVPLCTVREKPSVLLTMRSATMGTNKGDVSFPGGMKEVIDKDAIDIALRETQEEIGFLHNIEVWTTMPPFPSRTGGVKVTPVIAYVGEISVENCTVNKDEVEFVFTLTLESLCDPKNFYYTQYKKGHVLPVYKVGEHRVWGLTAAILHYLLKILLPDNYKNEVKSKSDILNTGHK